MKIYKEEIVFYGGMGCIVWLSVLFLAVMGLLTKLLFRLLFS